MALAVVIVSLSGVPVIHRLNGIPLTDFFEPLIGPFTVGGVSTLLAIPAGILFSPTGRASAIIPFLCSAGIFCAVYMTLGWRLGYLPAIKGITGWPTKRSGVPGTRRLKSSLFDPAASPDRPRVIVVVCLQMHGVPVRQGKLGITAVSLAALITAQRREHGIPDVVSCRAWRVSQAWPHNRRRGDGSRRRQRRKALVATINFLFTKRKQTNGSPRITADWHAIGWWVSKTPLHAGRAKEPSPSYHPWWIQPRNPLHAGPPLTPVVANRRVRSGELTTRQQPQRRRLPGPRRSGESLRPA